jgi:hypothetical protein
LRRCGHVAKLEWVYLGVNGSRLVERQTALLSACDGNRPGAVRDTAQTKLVEPGLLQPDSGGAGWELTDAVRPLAIGHRNQD